MTVNSCAGWRVHVQPRIYNFHGLDGVYMYSLEYITFMVSHESSFCETLYYCAILLVKTLVVIHLREMKSAVL